jgi:hypothetical protein
LNFGILTLATPNDYQKAIGLALSARVSNPGVPVAVACSPRVRPLVEPYFDQVVDEDPTLRGFIHKLHLDRYSPFGETFFFDSDVLLFRPMVEVLDQWRDRHYGVCGGYKSDGIGGFGVDRPRVLRKIGKDKLVCLDGAGHAYFRKPECIEVFAKAREVASTYQGWAGDSIRIVADEDIMNIVMTMLDIEPMPYGEFFSRYLSAKKGTLRLDTSCGICEFVAVATGRLQRPHMMHFAANEAPWPYAMQLKRLFKKFGAPAQGIYRAALEDLFVTKVEWPLKTMAKRLLGR